MELSRDVGRNLLVERSQEITVRRPRWREWPLWRLLGVLAMFGAIALVQFDVKARDLRQLPLGALTVLETGLTLSLLSGLLGALVIGAYIVFPLAFLARANNRFFDAGEWISHRIVKARRPATRWLLAYSIELILFLAMFYGGRFLLIRMGVRI